MERMYIKKSPTRLTASQKDWFSGYFDADGKIQIHKKRQFQETKTLNDKIVSNVLRIFKTKRG